MIWGENPMYVTFTSLTIMSNEEKGIGMRREFVKRSGSIHNKVPANNIRS
jgi:hypothetical protein